MCPGWDERPLGRESVAPVAYPYGTATDELHFDHDLPYSKGGTSITENNVQLMCARHNLEKGAKII